MTLIDTNVILRYLLNDHPKFSQKAKEILQNSEVLILTQVVAEAIYVLGGVYNSSRKEIVDALHTIFALNNVHLENEEVVISTLEEFVNSNLDFVDELLYASKQVMGFELQTFDNGLLRKLRAEAVENSAET